MLSVDGVWIQRQECSNYWKRQQAHHYQSWKWSSHDCDITNMKMWRMPKHTEKFRKHNLWVILLLYHMTTCIINGFSSKSIYSSRVHLGTSKGAQHLLYSTLLQMALMGMLFSSTSHFSIWKAAYREHLVS